MDTAAVASKFQRTWHRAVPPNDPDLCQDLAAYQFFVESYAKAQRVANEHEMLDSQRD